MDQLMTSKINIAIIGASGYTGGELLRLLIYHPYIDNIQAISTTNANRRISDIHRDLLGETNIVFTEHIHLDNVDCIFLCLPHGSSAIWLQNNSIPHHIRIIDLSSDFRNRVSPPDTHKERSFIYGLPELNKSLYTPNTDIANPGCFATCIQLSLLPLRNSDISKDILDIHCTAITGSTGGGALKSDTTHFSWRENNTQVYKPFQHQHEIEIYNHLFTNILSPTFHFIPMRGSFTRGILASSYFTIQPHIQKDDLIHLYSSFYKDMPFIVHSYDSPDCKRAINTNKFFYHIDVINDKVLITATLDNLLKGASGQAIQNMNILYSFPETSGLLLKSSVY
jgi:N-acetyl-gamma-glutamyl-phosphate reductase